MQKAPKRRASAPNFPDQSQLVLSGFETPFSQQLWQTNRWVVLAGKIPWDDICNIYTKQVAVSRTGRPPLSPRVVISSLIIKHMCNLDDLETVAQIENGQFALLLINHYCHAIFDFKNKAGYCRNAFPESNRELAVVEDRKLTDELISTLLEYN